MGTVQLQDLQRQGAQYQLRTSDGQIVLADQVIAATGLVTPTRLARSAELEKVAAFQQSMLEGIDIETMGVGLSEGLVRQVGSVDPSAADAFGATLLHKAAIEAGAASLMTMPAELFGE